MSAPKESLTMYDVSFTSERARSWRRIARAVSRALLTAVVLIALYYLLPLGSLAADASTLAKLVIGFVVFIGLLLWQVREIAQSDEPGLRALEGLCLAVPLFIVLFASTYFVMSDADAASFTAPLTRTDALYFTVTIFATVGFGDLSAKAEAARLVVTGQMLLDLIILGAGVRIILTAVQRGRDRIAGEAAPEPSP
jgi:voltage-gated potassium channel